MSVVCLVCVSVCLSVSVCCACVSVSVYVLMSNSYLVSQSIPLILGPDALTDQIQVSIVATFFLLL